MCYTFSVVYTLIFVSVAAVPRGERRREKERKEKRKKGRNIYIYIHELRGRCCCCWYCFLLSQSKNNGPDGGRGDLREFLEEYDEDLLALRDLAGSAAADYSQVASPTSFVGWLIGDCKSPECFAGLAYPSVSLRESRFKGPLLVLVSGSVKVVECCCCGRGCCASARSGDSHNIQVLQESCDSSS